MFVLVCNGAIFEAFGFCCRHRHHAEVSIGHAGPIRWSINDKSIGAARVCVDTCRRMSLELISDVADCLRSNWIERVILHALIANARTDSNLDLGHRLLTAFYEQRKISLITGCVENDRFSHLESASVLEHKRQLFLLAFFKIYFDVAVSSIDSLDFVRRRTEHRIQRCVAGVQLQRHQTRLSFQTVRRNNFERDPVFLVTGYWEDLGAAILIFLYDPTNRFRTKRVELRVIQRCSDRYRSLRRRTYIRHGNRRRCWRTLIRCLLCCWSRSRRWCRRRILSWFRWE